MKSIPMRQCIACRKKDEKEVLFRVVRTAGNQVLFDPLHKMNGRGVYLCKNTACVEKAEKKNLISLAFQRPVSVELYLQLAEALRSEQKSSMETLVGFANRSGKLVKGVTAVKEAAERGKVKLLILDDQTKTSTRKRMESISRVKQIPLIQYSGKKSLPDILGKENCRCVGITDARFAESILEQV